MLRAGTAEVGNQRVEQSASLFGRRARRVAKDPVGADGGDASGAQLRQQLPKRRRHTRLGGVEAYVAGGEMQEE